MGLQQAVQSEINQVKQTKPVPKAGPAPELVRRDKLKTDPGGHGQKIPKQPRYIEHAGESPDYVSGRAGRITAILTVIVLGTQGRSHVLFEYTEDVFNLPVLAVCFFGKRLFIKRR